MIGKKLRTLKSRNPVTNPAIKSAASSMKPAITWVLLIAQSTRKQ